MEAARRLGDLLAAGDAPLADLEAAFKQLRTAASRHPAGVRGALPAAEAWRIYHGFCAAEPCHEEGLLLALCLLPDAGSREADLQLGRLSPEKRAWVRLGLLRAGHVPAAAALDGAALRAWGLLDAQAAGIPLPKQPLFHARLLEALAGLAGGAAGPCDALFDIALPYVFMADELVLHKAHELLVLVMRRADCPARMLQQVLELDAGMKVKYNLVAGLLDGAARWPLDAGFLRTAKQRLAMDRGLAPAIAEVFAAAIAHGTAAPLPFDVLAFALAPADGYTPQVARYLLPRLAKACPERLRALALGFAADAGCAVSLETFIIILHTVSAEFGCLPAGVNLGLLARALDSASDDIRLGAFGCLCRSFGPLRPAEPEHLRLIAGFVRHLALDSSTHTRHKAAASFQQLFGSLFARLYALLRDADRAAELALLEAWLGALLGDALALLEAGRMHQYGPVDLALRVLLEFSRARDARRASEAVRAATPHDATLAAVLHRIVEHTVAAQAPRLVACMLDSSFGPNRQAAAAVLAAFGLPVAEAHRAAALQRLCSPREAVAEGAALLLSTLDSGREPGALVAAYADRLEAQLAETTASLAAAAAHNSLNGTLSLLVQLLAQRRGVPPAQLQRLVRLGIAVGAAVAALAAQPCPEGADLGQFFEHTGCVPASNASRLVLTFCWRAIKESTALLGAAVQAAPEAGPSVLEHLVGLLLSLRHPGAYSAVEAPLELVCAAMFQSPAACGLPGAALRRAVHDCLLQPEIQVTRRSAGLPLCVTAILAALAGLRGRPPVDPAALMAVPAEAILGLAAQLDPADPAPSPAAIHGLNILRALFRNAALDSLSAPYTARALATCFRCFGSASWSLRNSAMMLFGALVRRAFGSKADDAAVQTDVRQTDAKFPGLLACFREQLLAVTRASAPPERDVYPLLAVLQRLRFPSASVPQHAALFDAALAFVLRVCLPSASAKVRMMGARLLVDSLLAGAPEVAWPRLSAYLLDLQSVASANEMAAKLGLLLALRARLDLGPLQPLLRRLAGAAELCPAIRHPALLLSYRPGDALPDIPGPSQPYQFELAVAILDRTPAAARLVMVRAVPAAGLRARLLAKYWRPTRLASPDLGSLQIAENDPGCDSPRYTDPSKSVRSDDVFID